jgi:hypothetical protein
MTMKVNDQQNTVLSSGEEMHNEVDQPIAGMGEAVKPFGDSVPAEKQSFATDLNAAFEQRKQEAVAAGQVTAGQVDVIAKPQAYRRDDSERVVTDFGGRSMSRAGAESGGNTKTRIIGRRQRP